MRAEPQMQKQMAAAERQMAVKSQMAVAPITHKLEEEAAPPPSAAAAKPAASADTAKAPEGGDDSIDLLPPKDIKGGKGKALESSIEEAFEDKPDGENSHYVADHTDKV